MALRTVDRPPDPPAGFEGDFHTDPAERRARAEASGPFRFLPCAVARPRDAEDVSRLCRWAGARGFSLVPRGAGTGMPGGNVGPGISVDLTGLDHVGAVDPERRTVSAGPGAVALRLSEAARAAGLYLPPLPSSADRCTIGGMVANNAAGARSFLHGAVRDWVVELEVILADGERHVLREGSALPGPLLRLHEELSARAGLLDAWPEVRKNSSGYALDRFLTTGSGLQLLVGSEGTLGVVTAVTVRLAPAPADRAVLLMGLPELGALPRVTEEARRAGGSACEYFGRRILDMARLAEDVEFGTLAVAAEALLLIELEGDADHVAEGLGTMRALADDLGAGRVEATSESARQRLWSVRHRASPTIARAAERGLRSVQFIEDSVVPPPRLPEYVLGLREILERNGTDAVVFGHAGDGNLHVNPLLDVGDGRWRARVRAILEEVTTLVASLGGTLTGEHGDGRVRAPLLQRIWGAPLAQGFRRVKDVLDPDGILNPGVVLPLPGQDPLDGLLPGGGRG